VSREENLINCKKKGQAHPIGEQVFMLEKISTQKEEILKKRGVWSSRAIEGGVCYKGGLLN